MRSYARFLASDTKMTTIRKDMIVNDVDTLESQASLEDRNSYNRYSTLYRPFRRYCGLKNWSGGSPK
jgi:hypothetical protein